MRLIDADALIPSEVHTVVVLKEGGTEVLESVLYAEQIDYAPTVDAVEVVRCKDCRFYLQSNEICDLVKTRLRFYEKDKRWTDDCFCSWGERREDG